MSVPVFAPGLVLILTLLALVWFSLYVLKTARGRWALGLVVLLLAGVFLGYFHARTDRPLRQRQLTVQRQDALVAVQVAEEARQWRKNAVLSQKPQPAWLGEKPGSRSTGELVGRSGLEATPEDALSRARLSAKEKLINRLVGELVKEGRRFDPDEARRRVQGQVDELLTSPEVEAERYEETLPLPHAPGASTYRAAVLVRVPESWPRVEARRAAAALQAEEAERFREQRTWGWTLLSAMLLGLLIYLLYSFLNAGSKGHLAWPLRIISCGAYLLICLALFFLRGRFP